MDYFRDLALWGQGAVAAVEVPITGDKFLLACPNQYARNRLTKVDNCR